MHTLTKRIFASLLVSASIIGGAAFFASPVSALTVSELQAQIQELMAKVTALQEQLRIALANQDQTPPRDSAVTAVPRICKVLPVRGLALGVRGDDVTGLQEFLRAEGFLSAEASGYFGNQTRAALASWQANQGLSSVGSLGPLSRDHIRVWCQGRDTLTASPSQGPSPLTVVVTAKRGDEGPIRPSAYDAQDTVIDFGDGSERQWVQCETVKNDQFGGQTNGGQCRIPASYKHSYTQNGTYTVRLLKAGGMCMGGCPETVLGTAYVTVGDGGGIACTKEYKPVCASKPIVCVTTPCNPMQQTYGNACMARADGATLVHEGACGTTPGNRAPTISSFSGPTTLAVNQSGTWTVRASDPEQQSLSYSITWGDEYLNNMQSGSGMAPARDSFIQTTTFTHSYAQSGTYTVSVVVRDASGAEAKTTTTVRVGQEPVACTMEYAPVCGRPTGCANTCPPGMYCAAVCRLHEPQTYSNSCMLKASGAQLLHSGECTPQSGQWY